MIITKTKKPDNNNFKPSAFGSSTAERTRLNEFPQAGHAVVRVPISSISPNPAQPRKHFSDYALAGLSDSIKRHGVLQPLLIRDIGGSYELIAGERRLRAASAAGMDFVPCIICEADSDRSAELAIIENLQREDLNMFEEAEAIRSLIDTCGMTQENAAARLSCSQSYIANKLRLLRLPENHRNQILEFSLTERHARALLRISEDELRSEVIETIIKRGLNVAATEEYIDAFLCEREKCRKQERAERLSGEYKKKMLLRDMRLFYNSIESAVQSVRSCGIPIETQRSSTDDGIIISILIKDVPQ